MSRILCQDPKQDPDSDPKPTENDSEFTTLLQGKNTKVTFMSRILEKDPKQDPDSDPKPTEK
jgi:hypothetical protein